MSLPTALEERSVDNLVDRAIKPVLNGLKWKGMAPLIAVASTDLHELGIPHKVIQPDPAPRRR